ncbi:Rab geranylgeranyltransferase [Mycena indigotica]|uniref:Geranylgeranyl transferase type-2 subunit beta n=1 Tax=Mycena indigotica TaxID=2126181 RepID=A0A8H6SL61_9AGAR|nr:Rab geranylgeranyltransferase [Mycena indigotica]KAF7301431.1 Rab geranylgeranyltransferase [Mycena indigotica]
MKRLLTTVIVLVLGVFLFHLRSPSPTSSDVTAVVLNWVRLPNVVQIVSSLCREPVIQQIIVWNNYNLRPLTPEDFTESHCPKLRIYNSPNNAYFQARFLACANASTPYCFIQDDDYLVQPEVIRSLRARVTSHDIFLAPPDEWLASRLLSIESAKITFGFAWLGYGSMILRNNARDFLSLLGRLGLSAEQLEMADNYYSILRNQFPEVWIARPHALYGDGAFTVGTEGLERNRRHIAHAVTYLDSNVGNASLPYLSQAGTSSRQNIELTPCLQNACVLETAVRLMPEVSSSKNYKAAQDIFAHEQLFVSALSNEFTTNTMEFSIFHAVDGNLTTAFRSPFIAIAGDTFMLDMLADVRIKAPIYWTWLVDLGTVELLKSSSLFYSSDKAVWKQLEEPLITSETTNIPRDRDMDSLAIDLHVAYIQNLGKSTDDLMYHLTAHLRLNAIYWGLTALCVMGHPDALDKDDVIKFVMSCWDDEVGGFGAHPGHDAHIHPTLSAIQILVIYDSLHIVDAPRVTEFILSLQQPSGVFAGDSFGEIDTRFSYIAVNALSLLGALDQLDKDKTVEYIVQCKNFDGGFGNTIGAESHSGQAFVCCAALAILDRLDVIDSETLGWWLAERQVPGGGLNGRPEKLPDVHLSAIASGYFSALSILNKVSWIDCDQLTNFILSAQDLEKGGIADRPDNVTDVFHTQFGVAGLSILGYPGLVDLDPVYCLPAPIIEAKGLRVGWKSLERRKAA